MVASSLPGRASVPSRARAATVAAVTTPAAMSGPSSTRSARRVASMDGARKSRTAPASISAATQVSAVVSEVRNAAAATATAPSPLPTANGTLTCRCATWSRAAQPSVAQTAR